MVKYFLHIKEKGNFTNYVEYKNRAEARRGDIKF